MRYYPVENLKKYTQIRLRRYRSCKWLAAQHKDLSSIIGPTFKKKKGIGMCSGKVEMGHPQGHDDLIAQPDW